MAAGLPVKLGPNGVLYDPKTNIGNILGGKTGIKWFKTFST